MMVLQKAFKGDLKAYQEILDRLEGRAKQTNEIELSGGLQINWEEKKTYVEKKGSI
jgi:diaminopimelate decarboxylase